MSIDFNKNLKKFLLVDDDPEFVAYFLFLTEPYNLTFEICQTLQVAQQKIRTFFYDAYIVDLNLSDGSGIDLVQEIRQKGDQSPIAVISGVFRDEQTFKMLKEKYSVDFILDKPIYPLQLDQLLIQLCPQKVISKAPNKLDELSKQYVKTVSDKIILLKELIKTVQDKPEPNSLTALKNTVHKIAGSAGSYGFLKVSTLCKELEFQIDQRLSSKELVEKEWLDSLEDFLRKIKYDFQFPVTQDQDKVDRALSISRPSLYIIDNDPKFLELLQREKEEFDLDLYVDSNPEKAVNRLKLPEFNPRIIVSSQTFSGSNLSGFDLLEAVKKKHETTSTTFALILDKDDIDIRMQALQKGVKYIFNKPISSHLLLESMTKALEVGYLRNFKVLIIDDDPDVCHFISSSLAEIGIDVRAIENPSDFYKTLEEFSPDLLFLDIVLPKYDGLNLLKTLRADVIYQNLFVVVITGKSEADTHLSLYGENADDILYKPLNKQILQKCVQNVAKKTILTQSTIQKRIGLQGAKALLFKLRDILASSRRVPSYLVFFRIDHYSDLVMQHGQNAINELIISISNLLQRTEDSTIACYCIDASTFALLFNGYDGSIVEKKIFDLLDSIQSQSNLNINLICSIVLVSKDLGNNQAVIRAAESSLKEAHRKPLSPVRIVMPSFEGVALKKVLVLIEPNEDLLHILHTAFDAHHLIIKAFKEGKSALQELLSGDGSQPPALIISERKLPDMDGIEILKSLQVRYKIPIPFYFLTDFVAEKDISEGLKQGAWEYITKPFNLSLLVQKSIQVIFETKW
jgi:DNA-binding response OmpR family regulator